jgi:hypothetical protein
MKKGRVEIIALDRPDVARDFLTDKFHHVMEGFESVLKYTHGEHPLNTVYQRIYAGEMMLWLAWLDGKFCGFFTTRVEDTPQGTKVLTVLHAYIKPGTEQLLFTEGMKEIERVAKKYNCDLVRFFTFRDRGFMRKLSKHGYKPAYVEFVKEIKEE